jgi:hypothetical protein
VILQATSEKIGRKIIKNCRGKEQEVLGYFSETFELMLMIFKTVCTTLNSMQAIVELTLKTNRFPNI